MTFKGRVWKFGDDVNTDLIIPGKYLGSYDPVHLAKHAMEGANKDFARSVSKGDVIVAGKNFGCGSSREQAVVCLKAAGVSAVIAGSFARIFFRNAINLGLPALVSKDASEIFLEGDIVQIDLANGFVKSEDGAKQCSTERLPENLEQILDAGGLVPFVKSKARSAKARKKS